MTRVCFQHQATSSCPYSVSVIWQMSAMISFAHQATRFVLYVKSRHRSYINIPSSCTGLSLSFLCVAQLLVSSSTLDATCRCCSVEQNKDLDTSTINTCRLDRSSIWTWSANATSQCITPSSDCWMSEHYKMCGVQMLEHQWIRIQSYPWWSSIRFQWKICNLVIMMIWLIFD